MTLFSCRHCNYTRTRTIAPIMVCKLSNRSFYVAGLCEICHGIKSKFLSDYQVKQLPDIIYNIRVNTGYKQYIEDKECNLIDIFSIMNGIIN